MAREIRHRETKELLLRVEADNLRGASLRRADLRGADLQGESLTGASLTGARLDGADLTGARLDGVQLAAARLDGAALRNAVLTSASLARASLRQVDLEGAHLARSVLKGADLTGANLTSAYLEQADLSGAILTNAVLADADLTGAVLSNVTLTGARYDGHTHWPVGFDPVPLGAILLPPPPTGERLPEYRVRLERIREGECAVDLHALGERTKLGGDPDWIQKDETPACSDCGQPMSFVAQIDSPDEQFMFGDAGLIYVFYCEDCFQTTSVLQFS